MEGSHFNPLDRMMVFFFQDAYYFVLYSLIILILCLLRAHDSNGFLFRYQFPRILPTPPPILLKQRNTRISFSCSNDNDYSEDKTSSSYAIQECASQVVLGGAIIDYSAANEYVRSHYNQTRYFGGDNSKDDKVFECIYNARELQARNKNEKAMLNDNGIAILKLSPPTTKQQQQQHKDDSMKFSDLEDIKKSYLPELDKIIYSLFPSEKILMHCFWNPMIRGESFKISRRGDDDEDGGDDNKIPTANIAPMSHIDTDVGAYESIHDLLNIISKNKVERSSLEITTTEYYDNNNMNMKDIADAIIDGKKRFVILNFWRNMGTTPVVRAPLSILSTRYYNNNTAFPDANPDMDESKWYIFPNTTRDEVIAFYQYDRVISQPSDLWHCAVSIVQQEQSSDDDDDGINIENDDFLLPPRTSFDIRAFIVLDENVPVELDRFTSNRSRPILSFEESGCFCDEQAARKEINESTDK
jgi:hypothetical protein